MTGWFSYNITNDALDRRLAQAACFIAGGLVLAVSFWKLMRLDLTEAQLFFGVLLSLTTPLLFVAIGLLLGVPRRKASPMSLFRTPSLVVAGLLLLCSCAANSGRGGSASQQPRSPGVINRTPDQLAQCVIESFKRSDIVLFAESAFKVSDAEAVVSKIQQSFPKDQYPPPFQRGLASWDYEELFSKWSQVRWIGRGEAGIDWAKAELERAEYTIGQRHGISGCDITAIFSVGDKRYKVFIDDCYLTDRGWLAADGPIWRGPVDQ